MRPCRWWAIRLNRGQPHTRQMSNPLIWSFQSILSPFKVFQDPISNVLRRVSTLTSSSWDTNLHHVWEFISIPILRTQSEQQIPHVKGSGFPDTTTSPHPSNHKLSQMFQTNRLEIGGSQDAPPSLGSINFLKPLIEFKKYWEKFRSLDYH